MNNIDSEYIIFTTLAVLQFYETSIAYKTELSEIYILDQNVLILSMKPSKGATKAGVLIII
jgi:hypothetical protein